MMDEFESKRGMVQKLLGALKQNAGDELAHKIGGDPEKKQVTHTPVPKESVAEHPHNKESFKAGSPKRMDPKPSTEGLDTGTEMSSMKEPMPMMNDGGMAKKSDEPMREMPSDAKDAEGGEDPKEEMSEGPMEEQDEENNSSAFSGLMKKKKK